MCFTICAVIFCALESKKPFVVTCNEIFYFFAEASVHFSIYIVKVGYKLGVDAESLCCVLVPFLLVTLIGSQLML